MFMNHYLYFVGAYFGTNCFMVIQVRYSYLSFLVNEIWNGENYCSSVTGYGMKQNEWNLENCYYGLIYVIICASYVSTSIIKIFL